ncbi:MAG: NAD(P)/FAD-dependent oxidoreductase [Gammaproteobacteria bacterium]|nr:NAD(P)/FAD-dependent oxidoreductase [Gammaproteobacteria bacterium]
MSQSHTRSHRLLIIGAGGGGLCMAMQLKRAGIDDFLIVDKAAGLGGTWWHNTYPGAECDVQSHLYSFSFEPKNDWSRPYAGQQEILGYFQDCADKYGLAAHTRFNTAVKALRWDDAASLWQVETEQGETLQAQVVVSALGMFNNLVWPKIPGIADFKGNYFHSARWDHAVDLNDQRVGVIGVAASAIQFAPAIAPKVRQLSLFQRTANWVVPKANEPYSAAQLDFYRAHPEEVKKSRDETYRVWNSLCTFQDKAVLADIERAGLERLAEVRDEQTRRKLTPNHPFGCRRPLFSDVYYPIFNRDNVSLVTDGIERVTPKGILTRDGVEHEFDTIVYSTGFETTTYLNALEVSGRHGASLRDAWRDGAQAYLGITTAGFPNLFMLYGPNTNQGCILFMIEQQVQYILRQLGRLEREGLAWLDVRPEVMAEYNDELQKEVSRVDVWQAACGGEFYYRSASGRFVTNFPGTMDDFVARTQAPDAPAYEVARRA